MAHGAAELAGNLRLPVLNLDAKSGFAVVTLGGAAAGFALARFALGLGEAGNFPPPSRLSPNGSRNANGALATGIFNSGTNVGALVTPLVVPWIASHWGWAWAFVLTGLLGFAWLALWLAAYRPPEQHPRSTPTELAHIRSDPDEPDRFPSPGDSSSDTTKNLGLHHRKIHDRPRSGGCTCSGCPTSSTERIKSKSPSPSGPSPFLTIYLIADIGSIGGGWISSYLLQRGWTPNRARKLAMLICALCVVPVVFAASGVGQWTAVLIISLAAAAHQGWSANLFTLASDLFHARPSAPWWASAAWRVRWAACSSPCW